MNYNTKAQPTKRCAIYTRKSSEEGLEQSFNSLHAQREACESYASSQRHESWEILTTLYDDGGFSGGNMERPGLSQLLGDIKHGVVDVVIVYKVDRLSRSLSDFVRMVDMFEHHGVSFVSVTQQFNTSTSMGRLTLNVLLSFAQFEREVTGERIRDKITASKKKGLWMGGVVPLGYDVKDRCLVKNTKEAKTVQYIYQQYVKLGCVRKLKAELDAVGVVSKQRASNNGRKGAKSFSRGALYTVLRNPVYIGKISHKGNLYEGKHQPIIEQDLWESVQQRLQRNRVKSITRATAKHPSLLSGLLFDDNGNVMSPTHTSKRNRRYRYYVSQAVLLFREQEAGSVARISAKAIEEAVSNAITRLFNNSLELMDALGSPDWSIVQRESLLAKAGEIAKKWSGWATYEQAKALRGWVDQIIVGRKKIVIHFSKPGLLNSLIPEIRPSKNVLDKKQEFEISIHVNYKRCGIESKLIIPSENPSNAHPHSVKAIQEALSKALNWNQSLLSGAVSSMAELAAQENVTQRYIAHLLKLAFLSPGIMEAITKGKIPSDLTLGKLKNGIPLDWKEQAYKFGFPEACSRIQ